MGIHCQGASRLAIDRQPFQHVQVALGGCDHPYIRRPEPLTHRRNRGQCCYCPQMSVTV